MLDPTGRRDCAARKPLNVNGHLKARGLRTRNQLAHVTPRNAHRRSYAGLCRLCGRQEFMKFCHTCMFAHRKR